MSAGAGVTVQVLETDAQAARWDAFVLAHPQATCFHRAVWKRVIEQALGHRTCYLFAERGGEVCGVLPLGQVRSMLFGNALVSTPFFVYGGILAADDAAGAALEREALVLGERLGVGHVELRQRDSRGEREPAKDLYVTFRKALSGDPEENMKAIPRKQRAMVRKGIQAGLVSEVDDDVERFYAMYSESLRNLGTPVLPKRWFATIKALLGDDCHVICIVKDGRPLSALMSFWFRDEVLPYYGGGGNEARGFKANDFMYWELMRRACERGGVRVFDYGRSKRGTGSFDFKKNWGFEPQPLHYEYRLVRARSIPEINPLNPKYRLFVNAWQRLPLSVSRTVGPMIARGLG